MLTTQLKHCRVCKQDLPLTEFYQRKDTKKIDGFYPVCRKCSSPYRKKYYNEHKDEKRLYSKKYRSEHPHFSSEYQRLKRVAVLQRIAKAHGSLMVYCVRCGFTDIRALQIDHINGGGTKELDNTRTYKYYKLLLGMSLSDLKDSYQLLCANCNFIKKEENRENYKWKEAQ